MTTVKTHKATVLAREREIVAREALINERETQISALLTEKENQIASLRALISTAEAKHQTKVREALLKREEELRAMVLKQEAEVAARMARREEEIMEAVRKREEDIARMWADWERETREGMCRAVDERMSWVKERSEELDREKERVENVRREMERKIEALETKAALRDSTKPKYPLEEVKNLLAPLKFTADPLGLGIDHHQTPIRTGKSSKPPVFETPISRTAATEFPSAMKGVVLTSTGETLATPSPSEFARLFMATPKVDLNFSQIFDFDSEAEDGDSVDDASYETVSRPPSSLASTIRGDSRPRLADSDDDEQDLERTPKQATARPTHLRRPSLVRAGSKRPPSTEPVASTSASASQCKPRSRSRQPASTTARTVQAAAATAPPSRDSPGYNLSDEENLPSPFLKRTDRERISRTISVPAAVFGSDAGVSASAPAAVSAPPAHATRSKLASRKSTHTLRAMAVVNAANAAGRGTITSSKSAGAVPRLAAGRTQSASAVSGNVGTRPSIVKAQRTSEEARKALSRP